MHLPRSSRLRQTHCALSVLFSISLIGCGDSDPAPESSTNSSSTGESSKRVATPPLPAKVVESLEQATKLFDAGRASDALVILEQTQNEHGESFELLDAKSVCLLGLDRPLEAQKSAKRALELRPSSLRPLTTAGVIAFDLGALDEAVELLEKALSIEKKPGVLTVLGRVYLSAGRGDDAKRCFNESLEFDRRQPECHYGLGLIAMRRGENVEAGQRFETTLKLAPDDTRAMFNLGNVLRRVGRPKEAASVLANFRRRQDLEARIQALEAAVRANAKSTEALAALAETRVEIGRVQQGVGTYLELLEIEPTHLPSLEALVDLGIKLNYLGPVDRVVARALSIRPDDRDLLELRARLDEVKKP